MTFQGSAGLSEPAMVSGTAAKKENGTNIGNITITMVTGKTATSIVTRTKTTVEILLNGSVAYRSAGVESVSSPGAI
jgi:hypothetical protein